MYGALIRAAERWRGLRMTEFERRQLIAIRNELDRSHVERTAAYRARLGLDRRSGAVRQPRAARV
jgi:hypothetical protein